MSLGPVMAGRETRAMEMLLRKNTQAKGDATIFRVKLGEQMFTLKESDLDSGVRAQLGKLKESSEQLEGVLVKQMFETMQKSTPKNELDGPMGDFAKDLFNQTLSEESGRKGLIGIGRVVFEQMSRPILNQEVARIQFSQNGDKKQ
jgi:Rod binding domain-containing protein